MRIPPMKDILAAVGFLAVTALLVVAALWAWHHYITTPPYVDPVRYPVRGIDISAHNGEIDFNRVRRAGMKFAFIKASEGEDFKDKNFAKNYSKATRAGLRIGAYHFFRFDKDGVDQAINFLEAIGKRRLGLGIAIDVEQQGNPKGIPAEIVKERLLAMAEYLYLNGRQVTFYTNTRGYEQFLMDTFAGYPLWICSFSEYPIDAEWRFWQYNHRGRVDGIEGDVDLNAYFGSAADWNNELH